MSLQGKVLSVYNKGKYVKVSVKPVMDCKGCKVCAGLLKSSGSATEEREIEALSNGFTLSPGDCVKLELTEYQGTKAAMLLYGFPILGFLAGLMAAPYICNIFNLIISDAYRVLGAFIGLFLSLHIVFIYLKLKKPETFMMQVTSLV